MLQRVNPKTEDIIKERCAQWEKTHQPTHTVPFRSGTKHLPVIEMDLQTVFLNPESRRVQAQIADYPDRAACLEQNPWSAESQTFLAELLKSRPTDLTVVDPEFERLKSDLKDRGQRDPGIIKPDGTLINANTRAVALRELGARHISVAVLPEDVSAQDVRELELSLQVHRDYKRQYSYVNRLMAIDARMAAGDTDERIRQDFQTSQKHLDRDRWIYAQIKDWIKRSRVDDANGESVRLRNADFEEGDKLNELHREWLKLREVGKSDDAEHLKESRMMAYVLGFSKMHLRHIEPGFVSEYAPGLITRTVPVSKGLRTTVPGLRTGSVQTSTNAHTKDLRGLGDDVLRAVALQRADGGGTDSNKKIEVWKGAIDSGLLRAGRNLLERKTREKPTAQMLRAAESLEEATGAYLKAREGGLLDTHGASEMDASLLLVRDQLMQISQLIEEEPALLELGGEGIEWLRKLGDESSEQREKAVVGCA